jgi:hypothetical protein
MSDAVAISKFVIAFAVAYALLYVLSVQYNLALFTYHAATEEFHFLVQPTTDGPALEVARMRPLDISSAIFSSSGLAQRRS